MSNRSPKYSIIIPAHNGEAYLPSCIDSIITQDYQDYELLVSDDHSTDQTRQYLKTLDHPNLKVFDVAEPLSMTEHWELALSHARGEWLIFVGQDDGLQSYFFRLADKLTKLAEQKGLRTIVSARALFNWEGCGYHYGDAAINFTASNRVSTCGYKSEALKCLMGLQKYCEMPQMYTSSLFHKSLLAEAREKQNGRVFVGHPQDANLCAVATSLEQRYLKSYIPLGWVGSSPKSAGMAIASVVAEAGSKDAAGLHDLKQEYLEKIESSKITYHELAGEFSFANNAIYFWQSLLKTSALRGEKGNSILLSRTFKRILFCSVMSELRKEKTGPKDRAEMFQRILKANGFKYQHLVFLSFIVGACIGLWRLADIFPQLARRIVDGITAGRFVYRRSWKEGSDWNLSEASSLVYQEMEQRNWIR